MAGNDQSGLDGDRTFLGVESRLDAGALEPGLVAMARNTRMRSGRLETRRGIQKMNWVGQRAAFFPLVFPIDFEQRVPFVTVFGVGRFDDPNGVEWVIVAATAIAAAGGKVFAARPGNAMVELAVAGGENITGPVHFVQCFEVLIMFRGEDQRPLVMSSLDAGFETIAQFDSEDHAGDGTEEIPSAASGLSFANRLIIPYGRDLVAVSDALNYTRYARPSASTRINVGSSDRLVGLFKFNDTTIVASKESSLYVIENLIPDANGVFSSATLDSVTDRWGWIARRSVVHCGGDLIGLSQMGVMGVRQTEQNKLQCVDVPLSAPMQAVMDRINWRYASGAAGAYWDSKYYLAVPLDSAEKTGNEMMWAGAAYVGASLTVFGFEPGRRYRLTFGANDGALDAGDAGTFDADDYAVVDFTATQASVALTKAGAAASNAACTVSVTEIWVGVNNAVLVYDFVRKQWDGYDDGAAVLVTDFVALDYLGKERLFFVSPDGFLNLYEEGYQDDVWRWHAYPEDPEDENLIGQGVKPEAIATEWLLRGYGLRALTNKGLQKADLGESRLKGLALSMRTWAPNYSIYSRPEGVNEEVALVENRTRSRTRYQLFGQADWVETNENDDHGNPGREDYAVTLGAGIYLGSGLQFGLHQDCLERVRGHGRAQAMQVRILNTSGRIELARVEVETGGGRTRRGQLF